MFIYHLDDLIKKKESMENRNISDTQLANEMGISRQTLAKIKNFHITSYMTNTNVLGKILQFFNCDTITELIEWKKD